MNVVEIIGELYTVDSAFLRGWRWLLSSRYRASIRARCAKRHSLVIIAGVAESVFLMAAEVVALGCLVVWLIAR
jgi:hypothetical protein